MKGYLNQSQIDYVLEHLGIHVILKELLPHIIFLKHHDKFDHLQDKIIFLLSDKDLSLGDVKRIDTIPILYPIGVHESYYREADGNIIFNDDLIKSAFYFLSGYQELYFDNVDSFGRFPFKESMQAKLGITNIPVVNYYFKAIIKGLFLYCKLHNITLKIIKPKGFRFILSHDIDKIEKYNWDYIGYKIKELIGMVPRRNNIWQVLRLLVISILGYVKLTYNKNPFWTFDYIKGINDRLGFKSSYYFLPRDVEYVDANYDLSDKRLLHLYRRLINNNDEIGVHGTVASSLSANSAKQNKYDIESYSGCKTAGIRQHRLSYKFPQTATLHQKEEYMYDFTLGFAEHEGFRNSYCFPFKLYNFENNKPYNQWEIPLVVMDVTLFAYQKYSTFEAQKAVFNLISEIKEFGGVFTLLWHNTFLDEVEFRGIQKFYEDILTHIADQGGTSLTAEQFIAEYTSRNRD